MISKVTDLHIGDKIGYVDRLTEKIIIGVVTAINVDSNNQPVSFTSVIIHNDTGDNAFSFDNDVKEIWKIS